MPRRLFLNIFIFFLFVSSFIFSNTIGELKLCAIRVSFPLEDDESTTGNGQFLNTAEGIDCFGYTIDEPPHNKSYFKSQIKAVSSYFDSVSYGAFKVDIENSDIYPFGEDNSYELDSSMASYNPYGQSSQSEGKITRLFQDAIILADLEDLAVLTLIWQIWHRFGKLSMLADVSDHCPSRRRQRPMKQQALSALSGSAMTQSTRSGASSGQAQGSSRERPWGGARWCSRCPDGCSLHRQER